MSIERGMQNSNSDKPKPKAFRNLIVSGEFVANEILDQEDVDFLNGLLAFFDQVVPVCKDGKLKSVLMQKEIKTRESKPSSGFKVSDKTILKKFELKIEPYECEHWDDNILCAGKIYDPEIDSEKSIMVMCLYYDENNDKQGIKEVYLRIPFNIANTIFWDINPASIKPTGNRSFFIIGI